jgi:hypothetical protein
MERKGAHRLLLNHLGDSAEPRARDEWRSRIDAHLALSQAEKERRAETLISELAEFTAETLARRTTGE